MQDMETDARRKRLYWTQFNIKDFWLAVAAILCTAGIVAAGHFLSWLFQ